MLVATEHDLRGAGRGFRYRHHNRLGVRPRNGRVPRRDDRLSRGIAEGPGRWKDLPSRRHPDTDLQRHRRDLHSGHRKRYGVNVQILCDVHGRLDACSEAFSGSWHDKHCFDEAGLAAILADCGGLVGDSGYQGIDGVTPIKDNPNRKLTDDQHRFNAQVASIRAVVERAIAHIKNWRITTTRYRGHLDRINNVILTTVGLQALNHRFSDRTLSLSRLTQE
ncbi:MAG: transposase family protein [Nocardioidaceae bacterium]